MEKIVKDGMVAVAVSEGFGAGWSTWNNIDPMDARAIKRSWYKREKEMIGYGVKE